MAVPKTCPQPGCTNELVVVPEAPDTGTCLLHGEFQFVARMDLDGDE